MIRHLISRLSDAQPPFPNFTNSLPVDQIFQAELSALDHLNHAR
jgi:hypothetical protein